VIGPNRRRLRRGLLVLLLVLVVGGTAVSMLSALQRQLIYFPDATPVPPARDVVAGARDVTLHTADGLELGAWFVPATGQADTRMAVLVAPGNGGNRAGRAGFAEELSRRGLAVLLMDYRGYGGNPGSPGQDGIAADADAAAAALTDLGYPPQRTVYFGESLGSAVVAALQVRHPRRESFCARPSPSWPTWVHTTTPGYRCARCCATGSPWWSTSPPATCRSPSSTATVTQWSHQRSAPASRTMPPPWLSGW
jgi:fermentation-respiration switch protein FrsA (DUF1100 family)